MATRVVEGKKPYTGGKAISIDENKVISLNLRDENNLIIYDEGDDEIYVDLQLDDEITPTDAFPIGVNVGRVIVDNGWDKPGTIISAVTTSGDNIKIFYADEGTLWIDNGTGTFKQIYFKADVDALLLALRNYIDGELAKKQNGVSSDTAPSNPSEGDLWYDTTSNTMKVWNGTAWQSVGGTDIVYATQAEYNALPSSKLTDNKHYFIYTSSSSGRLPAEYQEVEWIKPSGMGPYIDSGLNPSPTLRFEMEITPDTSYTSGNAIFGNDWSAQAIFFMFYDGIYRLHNGGTVTDGPSATNSLTTITVDNSEYTINGTPYACVSGNNYGPSRAIYIWGSNSPLYLQDTYGGVYQLHSMQIKDNGTLVRDFVPCYRKLDSVIGLYDIVNDVFYTNGGTGTFTKGNDAN